MPRASLALERELRDRVVLRYAVPEESIRFSDVAVEFSKYLATPR